MHCKRVDLEDKKRKKKNGSMPKSTEHIISHDSGIEVEKKNEGLYFD